MFPSNFADKEYVMSLDKLDLSLLSQYVERRPEEKRLLWSKSFMDGESVYCKVQIPSDMCQNDDAHLEQTENDMCHICNIDIPQKYMKQHVNSKLHQIYKKLSEKVLENVAKQINVIFNCIDNNNQSNEFYCETCSKVVLMEHKQKHNRSTYHLKSIDNQKLGNKFVELYVKNKEVEPLENEFESHGGIEVVHENDNKNSYVEYNSDSDTDWNFESESEDEDFKIDNQVIPINQVITCKPTEVPNNSGSENKNADIVSRSSSTSPGNSDFELYLKEMMAKYKLKFELPIVENNCIVILSPKGRKEKISIDAFHSYKKINNSVFCQLCKIREDEDTSEHRKTERHVRNIMQPINNCCARQMIGFKLWINCLICNNIVLSGLEHVKSYHNVYYQESILKCDSDTLTVKSNLQQNGNEIKSNVTPTIVFCDVCNIDIYTKDFFSHVNDRNHVTKLQGAAKKSIPSVAADNMTSSQNTAINNKIQFSTSNFKSQDNADIRVAAQSSENNCVSVAKNTTRQISSIEVQKSTEVENKITTQSILPSTSEAKVDTVLPQVNIVKELTKMEKLKEYHKQVAEYNENLVECLVCDLKVPYTDRNIIEHVEGFRHRNAVDTLLRENKIEKKAFNLYDCGLCSRSFDNFVDHIKENMRHVFLKTMASFFESVESKN